MGALCWYPPRVSKKPAAVHQSYIGLQITNVAHPTVIDVAPAFSKLNAHKWALGIEVTTSSGGKKSAGGHCATVAERITWVPS
jgi:hypothetical protein